MPAPPGQPVREFLVASSILDTARVELNRYERRLVEILLEGSFTDDETRLRKFDELVDAIAEIPRYDLISLLAKWSGLLSRMALEAAPSEDQLITRFVYTQALLAFHSLLVSIDPADRVLISSMAGLLRGLRRVSPRWKTLAERDYGSLRLKLGKVGEGFLQSTMERLKNSDQKERLLNWINDVVLTDMEGELTEIIQVTGRLLNDVTQSVRETRGEAGANPNVKPGLKQNVNLQWVDYRQRLQSLADSLATTLYEDIEQVETDRLRSAKARLDENLSDLISEILPGLEKLKGGSFSRPIRGNPDLDFDFTELLADFFSDDARHVDRQIYNSIDKLLSEQFWLTPLFRIFVVLDSIPTLEKTASDEIQNWLLQQSEFLPEEFAKFVNGILQSRASGVAISRFVSSQLEELIQLSERGGLPRSAMKVLRGLALERQSLEGPTVTLLYWVTQQIRWQPFSSQRLHSKTERFKKTLESLRDAPLASDLREKLHEILELSLKTIDESGESYTENLNNLMARAKTLYQKGRELRQASEQWQAASEVPWSRLRARIEQNARKRIEKLRPIWEKEDPALAKLFDREQILGDLPKVISEDLSKTLIEFQEALRGVPSLRLLGEDEFYIAKKLWQFEWGDWLEKLIESSSRYMQKHFVKEGRLRLSADLKLKLIGQAEGLLAKGIEQIDLVIQHLSQSSQIGADNEAFETFIRLFVELYFRELPVEIKKGMILAYLVLPPNAGEIEKLGVILQKSGPTAKKLFQILARQKKSGVALKELAQITESSLEPIDFEQVDQILRRRIPSLYPAHFVWFERRGRAGSMAQTHQAIIILDEDRFLAFYFKRTGRRPTAGLRGAALRAWVETLQKSDFDQMIYEKIAKRVGVRFLLPNIANRVDIDENVLARITAAIEEHPKIQGSALANFSDLRRLLTQQIREELNTVLTVERQNMAFDQIAAELKVKVGKNVIPLSVLVPKVIHPETASQEVVVMEWIEDGRSFNDFFGQFPEAYIATAEALSTHLLRVSLFGSGLFHADPHQGNILVRRSAERGIEVYLLDWGMAGVFSQTEKRLVYLMSQGLSRDDRTVLVESTQKLFPAQSVSDDVVLRALASAKDRAEKDGETLGLDYYLTDLSALGLSLPFNLIQFNRFLGVLEQLFHEAKSPIKLGDLFKRAAVLQLKGELSQRLRNPFLDPADPKVGLPVSNREVLDLAARDLMSELDPRAFLNRTCAKMLSLQGKRKEK